MKKSSNYKVVDLVESYNFHIKYIPIRVHRKSCDFFEKLIDPYRHIILRLHVLQYRAGVLFTNVV
jgi:hypothetical protein